MLTRSMRADLGVMISASHNPYDDNGIKLFGPDGYKLSDELEHEIERLVEADLRKRVAKSPDLGRAKRIDGVQDRYVEFAKRTLPKSIEFDGLRVVIDCANGAAYKVAPAALWELGAEVFAVGVEPDGFNINKECGSTAPEALARKVREMRADIGIALDGDADRVLIVDEKGHVVDGDQLLAVIAEAWKEDGRLAKPAIVATVMSNLGLERHLGGLGIALARTPVGDRYVLETMREQGLNLGGDTTSDFAIPVRTCPADAQTRISRLPGRSAKREGRDPTLPDAGKTRFPTVSPNLPVRAPSTGAGALYLYTGQFHEFVEPVDFADLHVSQQIV